MSLNIKKRDKGVLKSSYNVTVIVKKILADFFLFHCGTLSLYVCSYVPSKG